MNAYKVAVIFISTLLTACSNEQLTSQDLSPEALKNNRSFVKLRSETILEKLPSYTTYDIVYTEDYLVLCNGIPNPYYFDIYDLRKQKVIGSIIKEGGGPQEFSDVVRSNRNYGNHMISTPINFGRYIYKVNIDSALKDPRYIIPKTKRFNQSGVNKIATLGQDKYILSTLNDTTRFTIIDADGRIIKKVKEYEFKDRLASFNPQIYGLIFQGSLISSLSKGRLAFFESKAFNWVIIDCSDLDQPRLIFEKAFDLPEFRDFSVIEDKMRNYSVAFADTNPKTFLDVTSNDDYIYALYSGKSLARYGDLADYGTTVIQMNWDGEIVNIFELELPSRILTVTSNNQLYSIIEKEQGDMLVSYTIP